jgi:acetate kinase
MGTRSGDLDPAVVRHLVRGGMTVEAVDEGLNRRSGLLALAGSGDLREVHRRIAAGDERAALAHDVYCHRIRKYVGSYYAVLGRVDAVVFTAGVGQHVPAVRAASLSRLQRLGIELDDDRNDRDIDRPTVISSNDSEVAVLVVPTNEEWEIARQAMAVVG